MQATDTQPVQLDGTSARHSGPTNVRSCDPHPAWEAHATGVWEHVSVGLLVVRASARVSHHMVFYIIQIDVFVQKAPVDWIYR